MSAIESDYESGYDWANFSTEVSLGKVITLLQE